MREGSAHFPPGHHPEPHFAAGHWPDVEYVDVVEPFPWAHFPDGHIACAEFPDYHWPDHEQVGSGCGGEPIGGERWRLKKLSKSAIRAFMRWVREQDELSKAEEKKLEAALEKIEEAAPKAADSEWFAEEVNNVRFLLLQAIQRAEEDREIRARSFSSR
jgi:hypothetical protein